MDALNIGQEYTILAADFAASAGLEHPSTDGRFWFDWESDAPAGMYVEAAKLYGTPTTAGATEITINAEDRYGSPVEVFKVTVTVIDPAAPPVEPEEPGEPADNAYNELAAAAVAYLGRQGTRHETTARFQAPIVLEFVRGYTRGHGFESENEGRGIPADLRAVIVSALSRLVQNPEQVSYYQAADYSERPQVLNGYTLPELAILRRYRRMTNRQGVRA